MPLPVRFSNEDFLRGKVIKPGLYHILVKSITPQPSTKDQSTVYKLQHIVVEPGEYKGIPIEDYFSEKAIGMAMPFIKACNGGEEVKPGQNYDMENGRGKVIKASIGNSLYNGRVKNEITDYSVADAAFRLEEE